MRVIIKARHWDALNECLMNIKHHVDERGFAQGVASMGRPYTKEAREARQKQIAKWEAKLWRALHDINDQEIGK